MPASEPWLDSHIEGWRGLLFIDVGANTGEWTEWAQSRFVAVHAYEPDPRAFEELKRVERCNTVLHNSAVGATCGKATLHSHESSLQSSLLESHPLGHGDYSLSQEVPMVSLASTRLGADVIKIDVEGYEAEVIRGLADAKATLLIEVHGKFAEVVEALLAVGYPMTAVLDAKVIAHPLGGAVQNHFWMIVEGQDDADR